VRVLGGRAAGGGLADAVAVAETCFETALADVDELFEDSPHAVAAMLIASTKANCAVVVARCRLRH
jgi:hypothetical protein